MNPTIETRPRTRRLARVLFTGALYVSAAACGTPKSTKTAKAEDAWRKESLSLTVDGYMFNGAVQPEAATWFGSGAWIGPNIAVTNAHVALRGLSIKAKDDFGKEYEFTEVLAVDQEADLAIIKTGSSSDTFLSLVEKPADPKSLRGTNVRVIGNTGGLGLSFYDGRITNVVDGAGGDVLLHDANTAGGSSGGPLIENSSGKLVGVNHSSLPNLNAKGAAPSWRVNNLLETTKGGKALALKDAFSTSNMPVNWYVERAVCMKPGELFKGVFAAVATNDLVADITPATAGQPIGFILVRGDGEKLAEALVNGPAQGAWTLKGGGQYIFGVLNPKDAPGPACATVKFGRIDWATRFAK